MSKIQLFVNVANDVAVDLANDVLPFWWIEVYPLCFHQSKSLCHDTIKWFQILSVQ